MPAASYNKFNIFTTDLANKVHDLDSDTLTVALTNSAPNAESQAVLGDVTQVSYTNCSSRVLANKAGTRSTNTYKLTADDLVLTASGGGVGPFKYVIIYNDTPASPVDPLICWYEYPDNVTINDGETFTIDFDGSNGVLTIA